MTMSDMYPKVDPGAIQLQPQPGMQGQYQQQQIQPAGMPAAPPAGIQVPGGPPPPPGMTPQQQVVPVNCPPGLEYLAQVDQLLVHQKVEILEAFTGFETNNKYEVVNTLGQRVYVAAEDTNFCVRNCCGNSRPFKMKIYDNSTKEVIRMHRYLRCKSCWFPCCLQKMVVEAPIGTVIGYVKQAWSLCYPRFKIQNANEETVLRISGPCCTCQICGDIKFEVLSADGSTHVGKVTKQWTGLAKELFTDADNFGVSFPMDLDVHVKATLMAAIFLIDFMYYEETKSDDKHVNS